MPEALFFEPRNGVFDTLQVTEYVSRLGHVRADSDKPGRYLVFTDPEEARRYDGGPPGTRTPFVLIVWVSPEQISLALLCDEQGLALARQFAAWVTSLYDCRIEDDEGEDRTDEPLDSLLSGDE